MALYIPAGRRRRRLLVSAAGALVAGLFVGSVLGRVTAPSVTAGAGEARVAATKAVASIEGAGQHYVADPETNRDKAVASVRLAEIDLDRALQAAPWLAPSTITRLRQDFAKVQSVAEAHGSAAEFQQAMDVAQADVELCFGAGG